jgi:hypothetical protein
MSATIRAVTVVSLMGGVVVVVLVAWIVAGHVLESGRVGSIDDWFHWLAPLVPPLVVIVGIAATNRMRALRGCRWQPTPTSSPIVSTGCQGR